MVLCPILLPTLFQMVAESGQHQSIIFKHKKFLVPHIQEKIRQIVSPMDAALEGRNRQNPLRPDWEEVKDEVMLQALRMKFSQNPEIAKELLATGDAILIEHTRNDDYWADGGDGSGKNKLGLLLMQVREELKNSIL